MRPMYVVFTASLLFALGCMSAQLGEDKVGSMPGQLGPATNRTGGDVCAGRQRRPGCADERVACVGGQADTIIMQ